MITPKQLLSFSVSLLEDSKNDNKAHTEACLRTVASRAYYAAFLTAQPLEEKIETVGNCGVHARLIKGLRRTAKDGKAGLYDARQASIMRTIARKLQQIKVIRTDADYNLGGHFARSSVDTAIITAVEVMQAVEEVNR